MIAVANPIPTFEPTDDELEERLLTHVLAGEALDALSELGEPCRDLVVAVVMRGELPADVARRWQINNVGIGSVLRILLDGLRERLEIGCWPADACFAAESLNLRVVRATLRGMAASQEASGEGLSQP